MTPPFAFPPLAIDPEVAAALADGRPVVALESTIITHGLPWPANLETALAVQAEVRAAGALPATIALISGQIRVGMDDAALTRLARPGASARKISRADLADCLMRGDTGATTVAATMICAHLAGIEVFATGGIGGVHRGAETSFDISADLHELARTPVSVVAAGPKAILDLPKTLEVLETLGVPVIAYGQDDLPAFWSRSSGLRAPLRADTPAEVARAHRLRGHLGMGGGQLVANPVPAAAEIAAADLAPAIEAAVRRAAALGIGAKDVTPFLLDHIRALTDGRSLATNRALVCANARLAGQIAGALAALPRPTAPQPPWPTQS
jgi:pseudouridine-5'-phosphate glycosidase